MREYHVRICEGLGVKFPGSTRHSRPGPAGRRSSHVRYAPKATVGHQNAIGRDGPKADITPAAHNDASDERGRQ